MATSPAQFSTINLGLPAVPETTDKVLFQELVRIYNALRLLAQGTDDYTNGGTILTTLATIATSAASRASFSELSKKYYKYTVPRFTVTVPGVDEKLVLDPTDALGIFQLTGLTTSVIINPLNILGILQVVGDSVFTGKVHVTDTVLLDTTLQVTGGAGFNGKSPQTPAALSGTATAPAGGVGTAAGGWDTAAHRDAAIAAINTNATAIDKINTALTDWGIGV